MPNHDIIVVLNLGKLFGKNLQVFIQFCIAPRNGDFHHLHFRKILRQIMNIRPDRVLQNVVLVQFFPYPPEGDSIP